MQMFEQQQQWIEQRCGKFTASEIHKLMEKGRSSNYFGKGAMSYIQMKAAEILTLEPNNGGRLNTNAMEWGNAHEHEAVKEYERVNKCSVTYYGAANPKFFQYTEFSGGSPDGMVNGNKIIEIKCPYNSSEHISHLMLFSADDLKGYAPEYYWQMVANMVFTGSKFATFISYDPRFVYEKLRLKTIDFDLLPGDEEILKERIAEAEKQLSMIINLITD